MRILGISSQFHDAAITVVDNGEIVFAGHAERYSRSKNDAFINKGLVSAALKHGKPDFIVYHEKSWAKKLRNVTIGNFGFLKELTAKQWVEKFYPELRGIPSKSYWHHETHAAAGVLTSKFDECAVMVIDAIGEFDSASIWHWKDGKLKKKNSVWYPSSLGLFYSAVTAYVGLKPMEDEYILMGMAAYGDNAKAKRIRSKIEQEIFTHSNPSGHGYGAIRMRVNLQKGFAPGFFGDADDFDIALAAQMVVEERIKEYAIYAQFLTGSKNLVYMGGVALNCVANSNLFSIYDDIHIMPNPGDAGSSLGAAALDYYNKTGKRVRWTGPYLGTEIPGAYPIKKVLESLKRNEIFGIANGRAEFGPRALGNRSLCADPRGGEIKDRMNEIKKRQKFRPFAPMILQEYVHEYFEMPGNISYAPYMQFVARCKKPEEFPAIIHADGTSRVQTVNATDHPDLYKLLTEWHKISGCPMLVNTSLNIKGQPIVDTVADAQAFERKYNVKVHTHDEPSKQRNRKSTKNT
jgi:carbamoyltransferase